MGNLLDNTTPFAEEAPRDPVPLGKQWLSELPKLKSAQEATHTKKNNPVLPVSTAQLMSDNELKNYKSTGKSDVDLIMKPPFSEITRILDHLYLTGISGLTNENVAMLEIAFVVNATYEMPLLKRANIFSVRIPVDDDAEEDLGPYLLDVTEFIHRASVEGLSTAVHCLAGASRSTTIVLAYLVKYTKLSLKEAFFYVHEARECARPNIGFWEQLIKFEKDTHGCSSVKMCEIKVDGRFVHVPDLYKFRYPSLFEQEVRKQRVAQEAKQKAKDPQATILRGGQIQNPSQAYEDLSNYRSSNSSVN